MILVNHILGHCDDAFWAGICEDLAERGAMEMLLVEPEKLKQGHLRVATDKGTVVGVRLDAEAVLRPGSVVFYEEGQRIVLARVKDARVLVIATLNDFSLHDALTLGHYLGSVGWPMEVRHHVTHMEIFVNCTLDEAEMEDILYACPLLNISWTFRDRAATDPIINGQRGMMNDER